MEIELSFAKWILSYESYHFWVMSYGNWELSHGNRQSKQPLTNHFLLIVNRFDLGELSKSSLKSFLLEVLSSNFFFSFLSSISAFICFSYFIYVIICLFSLGLNSFFFPLSMLVFNFCSIFVLAVFGLGF